MPSEAASDVEIVKSFLHAGMNVARINCAHDGPQTWRAIAKNIRNYSAALDIPCQIMMDLAGPKLRTGPMPAGAKVMKIKPPKDSRGRVIKPALVEFYCAGVIPTAANKSIRLPLQCEWQDDWQELTEISLTDTRRKKRKLKVTHSEAGLIQASVPATTYFETGLKIDLHTDNRQITALIGDIPAQENYLALQAGDQLKLVSDDSVAKTMVISTDQNLAEPATVSCGVPEALAAPDIGHQIKLDDGKFTGQVIEKGEGWLLLELSEAPVGGGKLRAEKGINFPDTELPISGLTSKDIEDLDTVCDIADIIALSFVNRSADVTALRSEIKRRRSEDIGIIIKIETRRAFENLPELLMTAMQSEKIGVLIARGDLGVEIGWRQMAEKQEEILWLCAAAHIPSIWATQVLETMAKTGQPTRSEITDAAMAQRAECVMLNKGPYIHKAVKMLHRIIRTMDTHQYKKSARLPKLTCRVAVIDDVAKDEVLAK
jgi:pyruvate kinase